MITKRAGAGRVEPGVLRDAHHERARVLDDVIVALVGGGRDAAPRQHLGIGAAQANDDGLGLGAAEVDADAKRAGGHLLSLRVVVPKGCESTPCSRSPARA